MTMQEWLAEVEGYMLTKHDARPTSADDDWHQIGQTMWMCRAFRTSDGKLKMCVIWPLSQLVQVFDANEEITLDGKETSQIPGSV